MTILFNSNVSSYCNGDFATFQDNDHNGVQRAQSYVANGYATIVVDVVKTEVEEEPIWVEAEPKTDHVPDLTTIPEVAPEVTESAEVAPEPAPTKKQK